MRYAFYILATFGVVLVAFVLGRHLLLAAKIKTKANQIRASKEPVTLKELDSYYKGLPLSEDGAKIYAQAFGSVRRAGSYKFLENIAEFPHATNALSQNLRENFEKAVNDNTNTLEVLRKAADSGACRFPIDYTAGWEASLAHLLVLRVCGRLEACNGVLKEQAGDVDSAIQSVQLISKYANSLNGEPDLIGALVQERLDLQAYDLSAWILNHRRLSADQLVTLQKVFANIGPTNWMDRAVIGDRCSDLSTFDLQPGRFLSLTSTNPPRISDALAIRLAQLTGQWKADELAIFTRLEQVHEVGRLPFPERLNRADQLSSDIKTEAYSHLFFVTEGFMPQFIRSINRDAEHTACIHLIQIVLAIERYRIDRGALPGSLDDLDQEYLNNFAQDPFDGNRLRYLPSDHGYLLYSIGPDRVDDQGQQSINIYSNEQKPEGDITFWVQR